MADNRYGYIDTITKRSLLNRAIAFVDTYRDFTEEIFPEIKVPSTKFQWMEFGKEAFKLNQTERAMYSNPEEINLSASFKEGRTQSHAITLPIDITEVQNADNGYNVYSTKQEVALQVIMRGKMKEICEVATNTKESFHERNSVKIDGNTRKYWNEGSSDPIKDIMELKQIVEDRCGIEPNRLIIGKRYWRELAKHKSLKSTLPSDSFKHLNKKSAEILFDAEKVVVPSSNYYDESKDNFFNMLDNILIWAYVDNKNMTPSWGNTFIRKEPEVYQDEKSRYISHVGADIDYKVIVRSPVSAGYINTALK